MVCHGAGVGPVNLVVVEQGLQRPGLDYRAGQSQSPLELRPGLGYQALLVAQRGYDCRKVFLRALWGQLCFQLVESFLAFTGNQSDLVQA